MFAPFLAALLAPPAADLVSEADLRPHIAELASDAYEGRAPGTAGEGKAVGYIAKAWARAGLQPAGLNGSWYQPVTLVRRTPYTSRATWRARGRKVRLLAADYLLTAREAKVGLDRAPLVFAGYGRPLPAGARLDRAAVLVFANAPAALTDLGRADERRARLVAAGAAAVLTAVPDPAFAALADAQRARGPVRVAGDAAPSIEGLISESAARRILLAAETDPDALLRAAAAAPGFAPVPLKATLAAEVATRVQRFASSNVVGVLLGAGRASEHVAFTGHWDHLGLCRPAGAPDRICNGAVDNASGIAAMIEVAERLGRGPRRPERSVLFVATTSEENGLLGARTFAQNPTVPLGSIVALFNIDTLAVGPRGAPVAMVGRGRTPMLDAAVDRVAASLDRAVDRDEEANDFYTRQDGYEFVRAGVPAVMAGGSFADMGRLQRFLRGTYHGPEDEYAPTMELGGAAEDATLHVALGRAFADPAFYPTPAATQPGVRP